MAIGAFDADAFDEDALHEDAFLFGDAVASDAAFDSNAFDTEAFDVGAFLLGEGGEVVEPEQAEQQYTGGFLIEYERAAHARRKRQAEIEQAIEAVADLSDDVDREIAQLLHAKEQEQAFDANLARLKGMVAQFADRQAEEAMTERARKALAQAQAKASVSAFLRLQTELDMMLEEEEFALLMMLAND